MKKLAGPALLIAVLVVLSGAQSVSAAPAAPSLVVRTDSLPTNISPESFATKYSPATGADLVLLVTNDGSAATDGTPITVTDVLPAGLEVTGVLKEVSPNLEETGLDCSDTSSTVTCTYASALAGDSRTGLSVVIGVRSESGLPGALTPANLVTVSGGGAARVSASDVVNVSAQEPPFALDQPFEANLLDATGAVDTQAGDHPNIDTTALMVNTVPRSDLEPGSRETQAEAVQDIKDVVVDLPAGLVGDPQAATTCPQYLVAPPNNGEECPPASVVGSVALAKGSVGGWGFSGPISGASSGTKPIFNVPPEGGHPAQFAFIFANQEITLYAGLVATPAGYVAQVSSLGTPRFVKLNGAKVTFFGEPALVDGVGTAPVPFFTDPTDCAGGPVVTSMHMDSWQNPGNTLADGSPDLSDPAWVPGEAVAPAPTGCDKLSFDPELEASPTTRQTSSPSGLNVTLRIPQNTSPEGLATPPLKNVTVALPRGLSISPSSANGLQACSDAQFAEATTEAATCPEASQVGTVLVHTPVLANPLPGEVFVGAPECDPCSSADAQDGRMIRLFIQVHSDEYGVTIKIPGKVALDPATGQLTATFQNLIQQPFDKLEFDFKSGERAPLSTPTACGSYTGAVDLTPWSTPYTPDADLSPGFEIDQGCGAQGFAPAFSAGTSSSRAGAYSPFTLTFARSDSQQNFNALEATLPPGLLAKLAGVPRCGEGEANAGTCPESTKIGTVTVAAGPGMDPYYVTGQIYFTGPYNGAPFGEVVEVPAVAGPFNLGVVVVRGSIRIDPTTAQATVVSNPFPSILDGIPLQVKTVNVTLNREGFMVNPTNCASSTLTATIVSTQNTVANVSSPFQAVNCANLAFHPSFTASTQGNGETSGHGASLDVKIATHQGPQEPANLEEANIAKVDVSLPFALSSRLKVLQKACTAAQFAADPADCPPASFVGSAIAHTPLLNVPLEGPAILVSHANESFPDLEVILQGEGVDVVLDGHTKITKGITYSKFESAPDAPFSSFELKLPEGKEALLGAIKSLCAPTKTVTTRKKVKVHGRTVAKKLTTLVPEPLIMPTSITAHDGATFTQSTKIGVTGCPKASGKSAKSARRAGAHATRRTGR